MRVLKIICAFLFLEGLVSIPFRLHPIHWLPAGMTVTGFSGSAAIRTIVSITFFGSAFIGIHRKAPLTWKLGWGVIVALYLWFVISSLSVILQQPEPHRWILCCSVVAGGLLVMLYWGFWWWRQKSYFVKIPQ